MDAAERTAAWRGYGKVAVIAGIGTRNYYRKLGCVDLLACLAVDH